MKNPILGPELEMALDKNLLRVQAQQNGWVLENQKVREAKRVLDATEPRSAERAEAFANLKAVMRSERPAA